MTPRRMNASDDGDSVEQYRLVTAETLRSAAAHHQQQSAKSGEERVSLFWRIFGGTILSIVALVVITAYQSVNNSITDLRTSISHLNEAKAEFVKKDDHAASRTRTWERMSEIQKEAAAASANAQQVLTVLQEKSVARDQQLKQMEVERKELLKEVQSLRERLARVEATKPAKPGTELDDDN